MSMENFVMAQWSRISLVFKKKFSLLCCLENKKGISQKNSTASSFTVHSRPKVIISDEPKVGPLEVLYLPYPSTKPESLSDYFSH